MSNRKRYSRTPSSSSSGSVSRAVSAALSTTGTFTIASLTERIEPNFGDQGWLSSTSEPWLNSKQDLFTVVSGAVLRTVAAPQNTVVAGNVIREPRFWVKKAKLELIVTNQSQADVDLYVNTAYARYDSSSVNFTWNDPTQLETAAAAASTIGASNIVGWTPFQSRSVTEAFRLGKTRKVHLQGGQNYRFTIRQKKPLYLNYAKLFPFSSLAAQSTDCLAGVTCGFMMRAVGVPVHEAGDTNIIKWAPVALDVVTVKTYEWSSCPMPYHFSDVFDINASLVTAAQIQPQTGDLNANIGVSS